METRTLARCLRPSSKPMLRQSDSKPFLPLFQRCYTSSDSNEPTRSSSAENPSSNVSETNPKSKNSSNNDKSQYLDSIDEILHGLDLSNKDAAKTTKSIQQTRKEDNSSFTTPQSRLRRDFRDPLALSKSVGLSAGTQNVRQSQRQRQRPSSPTSGDTTTDPAAAPASAPFSPPPSVPRPGLKLGTSLGRQVHVDFSRGRDLASAVKQLNVSCALNKVRSQSAAQRFHVRRGQMRKELRMARWRRLFRFSFQSTVQKIQKMRAQGW